jgi:hypothetical protein
MTQAEGFASIVVDSEIVMGKENGQQACTLKLCKDKKASLTITPRPFFIAFPE